jgi:hypothetical protein
MTVDLALYELTSNIIRNKVPTIYHCQLVLHNEDAATPTGETKDSETQDR